MTTPDLLPKMRFFIFLLDHISQSGSETLAKKFPVKWVLDASHTYVHILQASDYRYRLYKKNNIFVSFFFSDFVIWRVKNI